MSAPLVLAAIAAVLLAFVLALTESAIASTSRVAADEAEDDGRRGAGPLRTILADSSGYVAVLTFVRAIAEATAAVIVTIVVADIVEDDTRALLAAVAVMALVSFVLVGVSPRTLGRQHSTAVSLAAAPVVVGLRRVLGPVARLLVTLGNAVTPGKGYRDGPFRSEAELRDLVDLAGESALIEAGEREMLHSVFELGDTFAREVMVPRTDMITIEADKPVRKAMKLFIRSGFSRVPVVGESTDDIVGLLYLKDVVRRVDAAPEAAGDLVSTMMRPAPFVPESKAVDALLREMQQDHIHAAIVVDEYGGTAGMVTIEDIIEEIVGEIEDEYDRETPGVEELEDGRTRVPASMHVDDLEELFDITLDEEEVDTVGGLIGKVGGRVPILGSRVEIAGLALTAEKMAGRRHRIATVVVDRLPEESDESEDER